MNRTDWIHDALPALDELHEGVALFDEALATYKAARAEFRMLRANIRTRFQENIDHQALELAQWKAFKARARLMRLFRQRDRRERTL